MRMKWRMNRKWKAKHTHHTGGGDGNLTQGDRDVSWCIFKRSDKLTIFKHIHNVHVHVCVGGQREREDVRERERESVRKRESIHKQEANFNCTLNSTYQLQALLHFKERIINQR